MARIEIDVKVKIKEVAAKVRQELQQATKKFAEEVLTASKKVTPKDLGTLRDSGRVEKGTDDKKLIQYKVGYGGAAKDYALYVHEALEGPHAVSLNWSWAKAAAGRNKQKYQKKTANYIHWTTPGTGPKYLENPFKEMRNELPKRLQEALIRGLSE